MSVLSEYTLEELEGKNFSVDDAAALVPELAKRLRVTTDTLEDISRMWSFEKRAAEKRKQRLEGFGKETLDLTSAALRVARSTK